MRIALRESPVAIIAQSLGITPLVFVYFFYLAYKSLVVVLTFTSSGHGRLIACSIEAPKVKGETLELINR